MNKSVSSSDKLELMSKLSTPSTSYVHCCFQARIHAVFEKPLYQRCHEIDCILRQHAPKVQFSLGFSVKFCHVWPLHNGCNEQADSSDYCPLM